MAHWFHRNPLKSSKTAKFELKQVVTSTDASKICSELRLRREQFLDLLSSANSDVDLVEGQFNEYLSLLHGFVFDVEQPDKNSKLRYLGKYVWTFSLRGADGYLSSDGWFEVLNLCVNMAIWYMKRAAYLSAKDEVSDGDAKRIHTTLRKSAGIFQYVNDSREKSGSIADTPGNDLESRVLSVYSQQCIAEAQEVAIVRAIELKHSAKLICNLATATANAYDFCDKQLTEVDAVLVEKWRTYFRLKYHFYLTYAYVYFCEHLLSEDKCGLAISTCRKGLEMYKASTDLCAAYAKASGPGFTAKPEKHRFFNRISHILKLHLEKAQRQNSMIYYDKVPDECPPLEENAEYGLAKPIEFAYPSKSELWNMATYNAFNITLASDVDFHAPIKHGKVTLVKERPVYESDRDPSNVSGCSIS